MTTTERSAPARGRGGRPVQPRGVDATGRRGMPGVILATAIPAARITALLAVPFFAAAWLLAPFLGAGPALLCAASVLVYPAAHISHEFAHAALYLRLAPPGSLPVTALPTRWNVEIERGALRPAHDILVTLAGPLAGILVCGLPQALAWVLGASPAAHLALAPTIVFALQHIGSVLPGTADHAALMAALQPETARTRTGG